MSQRKASDDGSARSKSPASPADPRHSRIRTPQLAYTPTIQSPLNPAAPRANAASSSRKSSTSTLALRPSPHTPYAQPAIASSSHTASQSPQWYSPPVTRPPPAGPMTISPGGHEHLDLTGSPSPPNNNPSDTQGPVPPPDMTLPHDRDLRARRVPSTLTILDSATTPLAWRWDYFHLNSTVSKVFDIFADYVRNHAASKDYAYWERVVLGTGTTGNGRPNTDFHHAGHEFLKANLRMKKGIIWLDVEQFVVPTDKPFDPLPHIWNDIWKQVGGDIIAAKGDAQPVTKSDVHNFMNAKTMVIVTHHTRFHDTVLRFEPALQRCIHFDTYPGMKGEAALVASSIAILVQILFGQDPSIWSHCEPPLKRQKGFTCKWHSEVRCILESQQPTTTDAIVDTNHDAADYIRKWSVLYRKRKYVQEFHNHRMTLADVLKGGLVPGG